MKLKRFLFVISWLMFSHMQADSKSAYDFYYEENISDEEMAILLEGANEGQSADGEIEIRPFAFLIKDANQKIKGGIKGVSFHDVLSIEILWVAPELRHEGCGRRLMGKAEQVGRERKCLFVTLTTATNDALSFYQKCGYEIEYSRPGYARDSRIFLLKKIL